ncbi:MAG: endonuclease/exonuclease/phosphatase family protein [Planctomycetaceae bacterium]|nr:endonuclease/exonuclease/phosphatase family protein [Planctomycetaceae bacterium]
MQRRCCLKGKTRVARGEATAFISLKMVNSRPATFRKFQTWRDTNVVAAAYVAYLLLVLAFAFALHQADVTWWGTVLAFAPRWPLGLPLVALIPIALARRSWPLLLVQGLAVLVLLGPVLGLKVSGVVSGCPSKSRGLRVLSCNVGSGKAEVRLLTDLIASIAPDVVALQECPTSVSAEVFDAAWFVEREGQLCVASRFPIVQHMSIDRRPFGGWGAVALVCRVTTPDGPVDFANVHFTTVRPGLEAVMARKLAGAPALQASIDRRWRESEAVAQLIRSGSEPVVIAGDFNMTEESAIFRTHWSDYTDAFSAAGLGFGYTKHTDWHGVRIDYVLADADFDLDCCWVGDDVGSDHLPVVAEMRRVASSVDRMP